MSTNTISVLEGNIFVVSDLRGDIDASPTDTTGLFAWDTRMLSRWILTINGVRPNVLSTDDLDYFAVQFFLVPGTGTVYVDADLSIFRKRMVANGFHEDLTIVNHKDAPVDLDVRIEVGADFADLFEVKDALPKKGQYYYRIEDQRLVLGYRRDQFKRETWITSSANATIDEHGLSFTVHIGPHGEWTTCLDVIAAEAFTNVLVTSSKYQHGDQQAKPEIQVGLEKWEAATPHLICEWRWLERIYRRSLIDLAALRFFPVMLAGKAIPAAG